MTLQHHLEVKLSSAPHILDHPAYLPGEQGYQSSLGLGKGAPGVAALWLMAAASMTAVSSPANEASTLVPFY